MTRVAPDTLVPASRGSANREVVRVGQEADRLIRKLSHDLRREQTRFADRRSTALVAHEASVARSPAIPSALAEP
jgi:hypothetical protein